ncbi:hypothetical protein TWF225_008094 [Orbilia oligospora]|nr:hypothetical protein TWF225_008094 [Orbilia oligospora]KAF3236898.1 hypothetical protein TWF217_002439 [Orbilia oligospora]KAF3261299.1 hypothetical protein TWF128_003083 [Orbilia oligospora]
MSSSPSGSGESMRKDITLKLMRPGFPESQDFTLAVNLSSTVRGLKNQIQHLVAEHPDADSLRVIYGGRQLADTTILSDAFQTVLSSDSPRPIYLHVVIRPSTNPPRSGNLPARGFFTSQSGPSTASPSGTPSQPHTPTPTPTIPQGQTLGANTSGAQGSNPAAAFFASGGQENTRTIRFTRQVTISANATVFGPHGAHAQGPGSGGNNGEPSQNREPITNRDGVDLASGSQFTPQTHTLRYRPPRQSSYSEGELHQHQNAHFAGDPAWGRHLPPPPPSVNSAGDSAWGRHFPPPPDAYSLSDPTGWSRHALQNSPYTSPGTYPNPSYPTPRQQFYLAQGPNGENNLLVPPAPPALPSGPWSFPPRRIRSPLAPVGTHMTPPPGFNLDENLNSETRSPNTIRHYSPDDHLRASMYMQIEPTAVAEQLYNLEGQRNELARRLEQDFRRDLLALYHRPAHTPNVPVPVAVGPAPARPQTWTDYIINFIAWLNGGNPPIPNDRFFEVAAGWLIDNIWLALKLALGVYILGGGRGTRRDMILWAVATVVFLAQSGILHFLLNHRLQNIFNQLNAILPDLDGDRFQPPAQANQEPQPQPQQPQPDGAPHPQQLADRLMQQRNNRRNGGIWDNIQTSVGIFMASLVPGLGERVGNARRLQLEALEAIEGGQQADQAHGGPADGREGGEGDDVARANQAEQAAGEGGGGGGRQPNPPNQPAQDQDVQPLFGL